jgi:hypothetical protein
MKDKNCIESVNTNGIVYFIDEFKVIRGKVIGMDYDNSTRSLGACWTIHAETQKTYKGYYNIYTRKKEALKALLEEITDKVNDLNKQLEYFKGLQFEVYNEYFNHEELKTYRH